MDVIFQLNVMVVHFSLETKNNVIRTSEVHDYPNNKWVVSRNQVKKSWIAEDGAFHRLSLVGKGRENTA